MQVQWTEKGLLSGSRKIMYSDVMKREYVFLEKFSEQGVVSRRLAYSFFCLP